MNRAYSILEIKSVNDDAREIRGVATTPNPDRMGDIVEPLGVAFKNPMPLLWQHRSSEPVGHVTFETPTKKGINFVAKLVNVAEEGTLKNRIDEAWQSVKYGLVKAVSIGFKAVEFAFLEDGGVHFLKSEVLELSLVTIPANSDATITSVKSLDQSVRAAIGIKDDEGRPVPPGVSGKHVKVDLKTPRKEDPMPKSIAEQIKEFKDSLVVKTQQMAGMVVEGETLDADKQTEFEAIEAEIKSITSHISRLQTIEKAQLATATAIKPDDEDKTGSTAPRGGTVEPQVKANRPTKDGLGFAMMAKCMILGAKSQQDPVKIAEARYSGQQDVIDAVKAAVGAASTVTANNAGNLIVTNGGVFADFVEFLRPRTIVGQFGQGGRPSLRNVPFRVALGSQTGGGTAQWVGEGKAKPLTGFTFAQTTLLPLKIAAITVATMELLRDASVAAETMFRDQLAAAVIERLDTDFINPAKAASAGVSPASITNGVTPINSSGNDAEDIRADFRALMATFLANDNPPSSAVWIMPTMVALSLSLMLNPLGQSEFPGVGMTGGTLLGIPVIVSDYMLTATAGAYVALVNASDIWFADEGGVDIAMSTEASLQMDDVPTQSSVTTVAATAVVSMFQTNSVAIRAERTVNWAKRRSDAVAVLNEVNWGTPASA